jgi:hypothetical protein
MADDDTLYFPACNVTEVPEDEPANDAGFGLFPDTVMVKSEGLLLPPETLVVTVNVANNPWGGVGKVEASGGGIFSFPDGGFGKVEASGGGIFSFPDGGFGKVEASGGGIFSFPDGGFGQAGVSGGGIFTFAA